MREALLGLALFLVFPVFGAPCDPHPVEGVAMESGYVDVPLDYASPSSPRVKLYWEKFPAPARARRGAVFFLAGGPLPHFIYHGKSSPYAVPDLFPGYDFYMFDYRGFNCSSVVQSPDFLRGSARFYGIETMARDFLELKRALVGEREKVILFGGSFGGMLGTRILVDYPGHVERAVLFSSDVASEWFHESLGRLDRLIGEILPPFHPFFGGEWETFERRTRRGEVKLFGGTVTLTWPLLEVNLWTHVGPSVAAQERWPDVVQQANAGDVAPLERYHAETLRIKEPVKAESPPTLQSAVLPYYRCNVFFPKSTRDRLARHPVTYGRFTTDGLVAFWNDACRPYDGLPDMPFDMERDLRPVTPPVLFWIGGRDWFEPTRAVRRMQRLGPGVDARIHAGWGHDFGPDPVEGSKIVRAMIRGFLGGRKDAD